METPSKLQSGNEKIRAGKPPVSNRLGRAAPQAPAMLQISHLA